LGEKQWDVIHFNWGLHDLKYMGPQGENLADPASPGSHQQVPLDQYEANLRRLVEMLKATEAKLIWCSTTPVPDGAKGRVVGDSAKYNEAAARIMQQEEIDINDLYTFAKPRLAEIQQPANVHFTSDGSKQLAEQVAQAISAALPR
jgi:acyl-CoA thioesterase-1